MTSGPHLVPKFLDTPFQVDHTGEPTMKVGNFTSGAVYAFFDYDDEPIYVGQTNEALSGPEYDGT